MAALPSQADAVIIGLGGIVGASVAHHLIEQGWTNLVGLEKSALPSDIGSTAHASDFCFMTSHDRLGCYTTTYSQRFFAALGHYRKVGGLEVARVGDEARLAELQRKVASGKAFGTRVRMIDADEAVERFPLLDRAQVLGAMWDPDAGLVVPRSQQVAGELVERAVQSGHLRAFAETEALDIDVRDGRVQGVETTRGYVATPRVIVTSGIWGPIPAAMGGAALPLMPVEHPLLFFGPFTAFAGTGKEIGYPLMRDQGNSAYMRDTGDPSSTEGGQLEWGYYESCEPRLVPPRDILERHQARLSPSMRDLGLEQVETAFERAIELAPVLGELGWDEKHSFNGLLSVTPDGGSLVGEAPETRGLWLCEAVWVKDGPGMGKLLADWMTRGHPEVDPCGIDIARFYPVQKTPRHVVGRCEEIARKIYDPPVHPREPFESGRDLRRGPFWPREQALGGYFMEAAGWERAHGYAANETRLAGYLERVPERPVEWDARHFWRVSNAEQLALSDDVGMINLSHFAIFDIAGRDAEALLERLSVAKVGGNTPVGKGVYTHFLDAFGGVHSDLTIVRLGAEAWRVVCGGDTGHRDLMWMLRRAEEWELTHFQLEDRSDGLATLGLWGPNARRTLQALADDPAALDDTRFPFATAREIRVAGLPVWAFRISYVGEQGWELYVPASYGLALWDRLFDAGVVPVGIETYANSRRLEKSLRLQNVDLLTDYNLVEAGLARPRVKDAAFHGKPAYLEQRERNQQPATLCTLVMEEHHDSTGRPRFPVGQSPLLDPESGEVPVDALGRRSYTTSIAYGPSLGRNIALAYLPPEYAREGGSLLLEYFAEHYPMRVAAVGYRPLFDAENARPRG
ncbi:glycine cleavage system aminomethyltransferase T/glycine/D-amino acid oxidase-like deaminating enzyme [Halomonas fontilapidosi]|uniref:Glycine cleavage system aminomethyltransferase T/glycine/D-amino acid oxidase-like deaminating enzyme n=1 Tax=Halomonas fontilapidosi TaxID=616675 RepID=A0A7W5DJ43_9GAMM|nr:FAD-dependent oxidoreductase [Halomonas fontilapidosi]MBB3183556.1 glycine cleavage system aminomethyltransferase T/glycine/D-amino acid oxidase-like deaminating enzyme [Halomonas fontilapidosi]